MLEATCKEAVEDILGGLTQESQMVIKIEHPDGVSLDHLIEDDTLEVDWDDYTEGKLEYNDEIWHITDMENENEEYSEYLEHYTLAECFQVARTHFEHISEEDMEEAATDYEKKYTFADGSSVIVYNDMDWDVDNSDRRRR